MNVFIKTTSKELLYCYLSEPNDINVHNNYIFEFPLFRSCRDYTADLRLFNKDKIGYIYIYCMF